jgi:hypothetical protein
LGRLAASTIGVVLASSTLLRADEGMWLFENPPTKTLSQRYGFTVTAPWMEHLQRSSVRFNSGGSGSLVSADGLVMTNHHVGADALQKLSTPEHDYVRNGFHARTRAEELKCHDLELNVVMGIQDVTERVNAAVPPDMDPAKAQQARRAVMNTIEQESTRATGLRSDVVTLYHGGRYHLYRYRKYTDVRLVFAPEQAIAFFGGDPDNFEYPRYDLDICFFRVYENGRPVRPAHYLRFSPHGAGDGELIFVSGNPGRTDRLNTAAHLRFLRDRQMPAVLALIFRREIMLRTYSERSTENARRGLDELFMYENSRKARIGGLEGLLDPAVIRRRELEEAGLRLAVSADPKLRAAAGLAWDEVQATINALRSIYDSYSLLEQGRALNAEQFSFARTLLRMSEETAKPNAERLREYRESNLESLRQTLFSSAPIYDDLEIAKLTDSLTMLAEIMGEDTPLVQKVLAGQSPPVRAAQLIRTTRLGDVALRKRLAAGGRQAVDRSDDPMIRLARLVDGPARAVRKTYEEEVEEPQRQAYAKVAKARFALFGTNVYPDATFTLRLAFGVVKGYRDRGETLPPWTTMGGAYLHAQKHGNREPFALPASWIARKDRLNLDTPFNFVSTADIIGGNSGSPVVNRRGELVGIIFDGNIQSLLWDYVFDDQQGRALAVHSSAIQEALRKIYDAAGLADELGGTGDEK